MIYGWLIDQNAESAEEMIFSVGAEISFPHAVGNADAELHLGEPIIFDFFPSEKGGGYCFDMTRTWCAGYAPAPILAAYTDVLQTYH